VVVGVEFHQLPPNLIAKLVVGVVVGEEEGLVGHPPVFQRVSQRPLFVEAVLAVGERTLLPVVAVE
jgi:hypothetical protein